MWVGAALMARLKVEPVIALGQDIRWLLAMPIGAAVITVICGLFFLAQQPNIVGLVMAAAILIAVIDVRQTLRYWRLTSIPVEGGSNYE